MGRYSKDRKEFNNKLTGGYNNDCLGLGLFIQALIIAIGSLIYLLYKYHKTIKKNNPDNNKPYTWMGVYTKK